MEKYIVKLTQGERDYLHNLVKTGRNTSRKLIHAQILLKADESSGACHTDEEIRKLFYVSCRTVQRVRKRYVEEGIDVALNRQIHSKTKPRRLNGEQEAHLVALACSKSPEGHARWTLQLLTNKLVELKIVDSVSKTTVYETLKKMNLSLG